MIIDTRFLIHAAQKAGMDIPDDPDAFEEYKELYSYWYTFCKMQLGQPMPDWDVHYHNAKIITSVHEDVVLRVSKKTWLQRGFLIGSSKVRS